MKLIQLAAAGLITLSSLSAQAAYLDITGGVNAVIPNINLFKTNGSITDLSYNWGGNLTSNYTGVVDVEFTFLGKEASWTNSFWVGSDSLTTDSIVGDSFVHHFNLTSGQLVDFSFKAEGIANPLLNTVANGGNVADKTLVSFTTLKLSQFQSSPFDAILFFDDTGGKDDNHDDLVIGVNVVSVPESSTLVLMMMGLAGLFAARRLKA